jgi:hypothetical protein
MDYLPPFKDEKQRGASVENSEHFHHLQADLRACGINVSGGSVDANMLESMLFTWCHDGPDHHVPKTQPTKHAIYNTRGHGLDSLLLPYYENQLKEHSIDEDLMLPDKDFVQDSVTARVFPIPPNISILHMPHEAQYELTPETWKEMLGNPDVMLNYRKAIFHFFDIVGLSRNLHGSVAPGQQVLLKAFRDFGQDNNEGSAFRLARLFLRILASTYFLDEEAHVRLASLFDASLLRDLCKGSTSSLCHLTKAFSYGDFLRTLKDMHKMYKNQTPRALGRQKRHESVTSDASDAEEKTPEHVPLLTPEENEHQATPAENQTTPVERQTTPMEHQTTPAEHQTTPVERQTTPVERQVTPVEHQMTPLERQTTPVDDKEEHQVTPAEQQSTEHQVTTTAVEQQSTPIEEERMTPAEHQSTSIAIPTTTPIHPSTPVAHPLTHITLPTSTTPSPLSTPTAHDSDSEKQTYVNALQQETKKEEQDAEESEKQSTSTDTEVTNLQPTTKLPHPPQRKKRKAVPAPISRGTRMDDPKAAKDPVDTEHPLILSPPEQSA